VAVCNYFVFLILPLARTNVAPTDFVLSKTPVIDFFTKISVNVASEITYRMFV